MTTAPLVSHAKKTITILPVMERDAVLQAGLLSLWEMSVRKTHLFLSEDAISELKPAVLQGIVHVSRLFVATDENRVILAFMGIDADKIEMLFVSPPFFGMGIGKTLVYHAIVNQQVRRVDVNEQNPQATGFYEHCGFQVKGRSSCDDQGNPYPILHMALPADFTTSRAYKLISGVSDAS
ncbi:GNAT family N-acetyltransferase [Desulfosarcina sp. OttesenSCG-928-A07]|nr:GNAT family N-acetyltransferase [Desulfosarcina sp. OttesenSCG-928-G17]MDL2328448.1 GNAT family N-acetyltransferase [Desulfosarcina sp. OttesenSCG-928-A07]